MFKKLMIAIAMMAGIAASSHANASILDLKIGAAQIFDVQYSWAHSNAPNNPDYSCYNDPSSCDVLNVSGLQAPYESTPNNFTHPALTAGQYYGFINSPTVPGTYGMVVFNANGTQAYVIHNTGDLYKLSGSGIFYVGGGFFGTVITPSAGYSYNSTVSLNVGLGTPTSSTETSYAPPSTTVLTAGQTASNNTPPSPPPSPTVVSTTQGTPIVTTSTVNGNPTTTSITNTSHVTSIDSNGHQVVTTYYTVTTTTTTPTTTTTTTTPVTVTTYSDNTTTTTNGTPVTTTTTNNVVTSSTTQPMLQSIATTVNVPTTSTSSGTATTTQSVVTWPSTSQTTITYTSSKSNNNVSVNKNTTIITDTPTTTTTTVTTPITTTTTVTPTTTTVDANNNVIGVTYGTPTSTNSTVNQVVSTNLYADNYTTASSNTVKTANIAGGKDMIDYQNNNLFLIDPFFQQNGSWVTPSYSIGKTINGNIGSSGFAFGYQGEGEGNVWGIAGYYGSTSLSGYNNSTGSTTTGSATAYAVIDTGNGKIKIAGGLSNSDNTTTVSIPDFALANQQKLNQKNVYADIAYYSPFEMLGFTPFVGTIINDSIVTDNGNSGSSLLNQSPTTGTTTLATPYVGVQRKIDDDIAVQGKVSQSPTYGTVVSGKVIAKKKITDNTSLFISAGYDKGNHYDNATVLIGLTIDF